MRSSTLLQRDRPLTSIGPLSQRRKHQHSLGAERLSNYRSIRQTIGKTALFRLANPLSLSLDLHRALIEFFTLNAFIRKQGD